MQDQYKRLTQAVAHLRGIAHAARLGGTIDRVHVEAIEATAHLVAVASAEVRAMHLNAVGHLAIQIINDWDEAADRDAGFDAGEFSGPACARSADAEIIKLAERHGFTQEDVIREVSDISHADDGPHGRIE